MNKAIMVGRLAKDPEVRVTTTGKSVASFTLATDRNWKDANGQKVADFHNIVLWGKLAQLAGQYLHKGDQMSLVGEIQNRSYDDKTGTKRYITEIVGSEIHFLSPKGSKVEAKDPYEGFTEVSDEPLPF